MNEQKKESYIHIRIDDTIKRDFQEACSNKLQTPSKVIRKLLLDYIADSKPSN